MIPPRELVTPAALRIAHAGYAAPLTHPPPTQRAEHRARLRVALVAAAPGIVGGVLLRWAYYLTDRTIDEAAQAQDQGLRVATYHAHRGAIRAFEDAADALEDHSIICTGGLLPKETQ